MLSKEQLFELRLKFFRGVAYFNNFALYIVGLLIGFGLINIFFGTNIGLTSRPYSISNSVVAPATFSDLSPLIFMGIIFGLFKYFHRSLKYNHSLYEIFIHLMKYYYLKFLTGIASIIIMIYFLSVVFISQVINIEALLVIPMSVFIGFILINHTILYGSALIDKSDKDIIKT